MSPHCRFAWRVFDPFLVLFLFFCPFLLGLLKHSSPFSVRLLRSRATPNGHNYFLVVRASVLCTQSEMLLDLRRRLLDQCCCLQSLFQRFARTHARFSANLTVLSGIGTGAVQMRLHDWSQQCHLHASVSGSVLSIKCAERLASVSYR